MKNMFNQTFYRFTMGFIGILLVSFALSALISRIDQQGSLPARVQVGK